MKLRGEITVFLSLTIVCIMSLFTGLLESARTAGARLYLQMALNSAMDSVMSQYNRNLWDMYHLLFLESESETAVLQSFEAYLDYYLRKENWYPMKLQEAQLTEMKNMVGEGGIELEKEIMSYAAYCLPEIAGELFDNSEELEEAEKAGDFRTLFQVCKQAGRKTASLEKKRKKAEASLKKIHEQMEKMQEKAAEERKGQTVSAGKTIRREIKNFSDAVREYEKEAEKVSAYKKELEISGETDVKDAETAGRLEQELLAYGQVDEAAKEQLLRYRESEEILKAAEKEIEALIDELETSDSPDWDSVLDALQSICLPENAMHEQEDEQKAQALDQLEAFLTGELLEIVVPKDKAVSAKKVSQSGIPSASNEKSDFADEENILEKGTINEYVFLYFNSFLEKNDRGAETEKKPLQYEQEYLLCGADSDRENLKKTMDMLLTIRGAANLMYLLSAPERKAEADGLAAAVSGGNAPVQLVMSFFIMTLWALGEAVWDVKCLLAGGGVPFFKTSSTWRIGLEELLTLRFLSDVELKENPGKTYQDYMRILFLLLDRQERNYRMMDLIQWNVRTVQSDFAASDCLSQIKINTEVVCRHVFAMKSEYVKRTETEGGY